MAKTLRVLLIEDSERDAALLIRELKRGEFDLVLERVENADAMSAALERQTWDIVVSDYYLPAFSAPAALELLRKTGLDLPFIIVSGTIGEEAAVEAMRAGARDFMPKGQFSRLLPAIARELKEAGSRAERRVTEHHLFTSSPLPKWVCSTTTLKFVAVNDAAISKYGYSRDEFASISLRDIRIDEGHTQFERWLQQPRKSETYAGEFKHRAKDGSILEVEVYLRDITYGGERAQLSVILDVTERKTAERQTQRIFETSQDVILVTDHNGTLLQVSPSSEKVLGYLPQEMIGHNGSEFVLPEDLEATRGVMRAARRGSATRNFRCRYTHKGGRIVTLVWMVVWSEPDRRHFFIGRDMTEYEQTEQQLRQAQKMEAVGQLTGGVAHDFNNILMVIVANVEMLEENENLDPEVLERLKGIEKATERATAVTRQLLAFSRKQALQPQRTNINDLVVTTGKLLRRALGEQIEIEEILADGLWHAEIDRAQLDSALVNLSINARDAMPEGGRLLIETSNATLDDDYVALNREAAAGDYVMLAVTDTGKGMPADIITRVFEPFFTTKEVGKGTGLGLSMVYGFVKQSKGHIKIYSEVGRGTSIKLYLPRSFGEQDALAAQQGPPILRGHERILVVEDDQQVRGAVLSQLRSLGYITSEAADGAAGIEAFESAPQAYDLLLTDVIMPGRINGKALADEVNRRWPATKVVFMSGYTENAIVHHGRLDAGVLLLSKPFRKVELAQMIRKALDGSDK